LNTVKALKDEMHLYGVTLTVRVTESIQVHACQLQMDRKFGLDTVKALKDEMHLYRFSNPHCEGYSVQVHLVLQGFHRVQSVFPVLLQLACLHGREEHRTVECRLG
jgi:hypothetical protein